MSPELDYAEIARQARRVVDAKRAQATLEQAAIEEAAGNSSDTTGAADARSRKRIKYSRSTTGCLGCRQQKVKCDETMPTCLRCVAARRPCDYPAPREGSVKKRGGSAKAKEDKSGATSKSPSAKIVTPAGGIVVNGHQSGNLNASTLSLLPNFLTAVSDERHTSMQHPHPVAIRPTSSDGGSQSFHQEDPLAGIMIAPTQLAARTLQAETHAASTPYDLDCLHDFMQFTPTGTSSVTHASPAAPLHTPSLPATAALPAVFPTHHPNGHETPTQFANLNKSALLSRRTGKIKNNVPEHVKPAQLSASSVHMTVESILHAFTHDDSLFEFGPSHRSTHNATGTIDALSNAFPSPTARSLFLHFCNNTSRILITMGANNNAPNPLLGLCTPAKLLDTNSAASAALRMSMLSMSVTHLPYGGALGIDPTAHGPTWAGQKASLKALGNKFKRAALSNILLAASPEGSANEDDSVLAACLYLLIRDVISADPTWSGSMEYALNLVSRRGGPQAMLRSSTSTFTRRYLLEQIATHDVFSSFISGKEPTLLGNFDPWWFESVQTSTTRWEWESVERTFGISRAMIDLLARMTVLDSRKRRLGISLQADAPEMWDIGQHFIRESHCLLLELDIWGNSLSALPQHVRVSCGDYIYKYMSVIYILADILEQPITTPRIVKSIDYVLELCSEASAMRMSIMLVWPLLISGVHCAVEVRPKVRSLFTAFQSEYCEDLQVARTLLEEQWRLIDSGQGRQRWQDLMRRMDLNVLVL